MYFVEKISYWLFPFPPPEGKTRPPCSPGHALTPPTQTPLQGKYSLIHSSPIYKIPQSNTPFLQAKFSPQPLNTHTKQNDLWCTIMVIIFVLLSDDGRVSLWLCPLVNSTDRQMKRCYNLTTVVSYLPNSLPYINYSINVLPWKLHLKHVKLWNLLVKRNTVKLQNMSWWIYKTIM